jgi:hypothetical protein
MKRITILLLILFMSQAHAGGGGHAVPVNDKWKLECSSCHLAYPPQLLTEGDWQQLMGRLDKHFGVNAVLDAGDNKEILEFLKRHSGSDERHHAASLRISDTIWFRQKHRNVSDREWAHPDVKSRSNCTACHTDPAGRLGLDD